MKKQKMVTRAAQIEVAINLHKILHGNVCGKRHHLKPKSRCEDNIIHAHCHVIE
jgi:hypothetical protein